jgi:tetratricopeptide (TPR) repeat protein
MMRRRINLFCALCLACLLSACQSKPEKIPGLVKKPEKISLKGASELERNRRYMEALKQYHQLAASAANRDELYSAMRGKARCLRAMGRLKLALSALEPISVEPQTPAECLQLALAGELLLQMRKYQEAESSLEVALDGVRDEEEKYAQWTAVASANLGNAYLRNGKLRQSKTMYGKAAKLFHYLNNPELEKKCFKLTLALDQIQTLE